MLVTTQWPLKRAATSPHLSGFVFYGCLESLTGLSALWQDSEPLILSKVMNDLVIIKYDINAIKKDADLHIYTLYLSHVLGSKLQRNSRAKGFLNDFKINAFK